MHVPGWIQLLARITLTVAIPPLLVLTGVRLVMTHTFLDLEYNRPGFPPDRYGFTTEDRLRFAPFAVDYLRTDADINYLGDLTFPDGTPLFGERELRHMEDVKQVTEVALQVHAASGVIILLAGLTLARRTIRYHLWQGLFDGAMLTIALIVTLVVLVFASWDFFFENFHSLFFEGDTWVFSTSDTLIRLFPEQFWFDAAMVIGGFAVLSSLGIILVTRRLAHPGPTPTESTGGATNSPT